MPHLEPPGVDARARARIRQPPSEAEPPAAPSCRTPAKGPAGWPWLPPALLAVALVAMAADGGIAQWFLEGNYPKVVAELIEVCEAFGNGFGVMLLALVVYQLDVGRRRMLPRLLACSLGAGIAANVVKLLVARTRPYAFDFEGGVLATFGEWFPFLRGGAAVQSFPSGHTATAAGLAVALTWLYPRGRWMFALLAVLVACQRMQSGSHYPSDVLVGAAVGLVVARACLGPGWLAPWFDRFESPQKGGTG